MGYFPAMHRVVALVRPVQSTFELGCAVEVFGTQRAGVPQHYEFEVCTQTPGLVPTSGGYAMAVSQDLSGARPREHRDHPGLAAVGGAAVRPRARRAAPGARARGAAGHDLLRGVRAGPYGAAGRPLGHHALGARRAAATGVPPGARGTGQALRGPRRRRHQRRRGRGHRPVPAPGPPGPRGRARRPCRAPHGDAAAPRGRTGAVRAVPSARGRARRPARMGRRAPRDTAVGARPGRAPRRLSPHAGPALRRPARHEPGRVAALPPGDRGAHSAGGDGPAGRGDRGPCRPHLRGQPAPPLPRPGRHDPGRLPAGVPLVTTEGCGGSGSARVAVAQGHDEVAEVAAV